VQEVASQIQSNLANARKVTTLFERDKSTTGCDTTTMDDVVHEIGAIKTGAIIELAAAALNEKAEACMNRLSKITTKPVVEDIPDSLDPGKPKSPNNRSNDKPVVEDIPDSLDPGKPKSSNNRPNDKPTVEDIPDSLDPGTKRTNDRPNNQDGNRPQNNPPPQSAGGGGNASTSSGDRNWVIRNEYGVEMIQIALRGGQVVWRDRQAHDHPPRQTCTRDPALFSGSFDGSNIALDWTINAEFCPTVGKYASTRVRYTCALQLNSNNNLSGTCTTYPTDWSSDMKTLVAKPPTTGKAEGTGCVDCQ
jgi:hypothetical protein